MAATLILCMGPVTGGVFRLNCRAAYRLSSPAFAGRSGIPRTAVDHGKTAAYWIAALRARTVENGGNRGRQARAFSRHDVPELCQKPPSKMKRAQGRPGAGWHPWPACSKKSRRQSPQVQPDHPGLPCAMVLTVSFVLSPGTGLSCPRRRAARDRASWHQRRGVRTTRLRRPRSHQSSAQDLRAEANASIASRAQRS